MKPTHFGEKSKPFIHSYIEVYLQCDKCDYEETDSFFLKIDKEIGLMQALTEIEPRHCMNCAYGGAEEIYKTLTIGYIKLNQIGINNDDIFQE